MTLTTTPVPLRADADGSIRVGETPVLLDTVIAAFRDGASAEQIVDQYPSVNLTQVYAVIAYYLQHTREVDTYLAGRREGADLLRSETRARYGRPGIRERLLARQQARRPG